MKRYPVGNDHNGWAHWYIKRYNLTKHHHAEQLAMYYMLLALRDKTWTDKAPPLPHMSRNRLAR